MFFFFYKPKVSRLKGGKTCLGQARLDSGKGYQYEVVAVAAQVLEFLLE